MQIEQQRHESELRAAQMRAANQHDSISHAQKKGFVGQNRNSKICNAASKNRNAASKNRNAAPQNVSKNRNAALQKNLNSDYVYFFETY